MTRPPAAPDDDELDELPPLDGDAGESDEERAVVDELDDPDADPGLDDETGEDDPADAEEIVLDETGASWLGESSDAAELDLGEIGLIELREGQDSADEVDDGPPAEDDLIDEGPARASLDAGDEGPVDPDEDLRDEDLPALDADDEGEAGDERFMDDRFAADEPLGLPWASRPWVPVGAPLGIVRATAIACGVRGAFVGGRADADVPQLIHVDLEGAHDVLPALGLGHAEIHSLFTDARETGRVLALLSGGRAALSNDGGHHFAVAVDAVSVVGAAFSFGDLWLSTQAGALLKCSGDDIVPKPSAVAGSVRALTRDGDTVVALVTGDDARPIALVRSDSGGALLAEPVHVLDVPAGGCLAARAGWVALPGKTGVVRRTAGGEWRAFPWAGSVTALAFMDDAGTLLAATYSEADDTTALVRVDAEAEVSVLARVGAPREQAHAGGRTLGMAYDDARGVVWLAGGFGVAVFATADR